MAAAAAEWINFYDADDVLAFPLKGLSEHYDKAVDEDRSVSVGALLIGMSPVSHVAYWNDKAVMRPIANSLAWLWNARRIRRCGRRATATPSGTAVADGQRSSMLSDGLARRMQPAGGGGGGRPNRSAGPAGRALKHELDRLAEHSSARARPSCRRRRPRSRC